jgi:hypothetical protein
MKFAVPISRSLGMALALASIGCNSRAQDVAYAVMGKTTTTTATPNTTAKKSSTSDIALAPEVEKKLQELLDKAKVKKGDSWNDKMQKEVDDITAATSLSDPGKQALDAAAKQAVTASLANWSPKLPEVVRRELGQMPKEQALSMLTAAAQQLDALLSWSDMATPSVSPDEQDVWTKALHQTLTPAQFDAWTQAQDKHKDDVEKEISTLLKTGADRARMQETNQIMGECKSIESVLKLPKDRADKLEALSKTAIDQSVESWRKLEEKALLAMSEEQRKPLLNNRFFIMPGPEDSAAAMPAWTDGLKQFLTSQEQAQLQGDKDTRKVRREHVMGQVLVTLLDDKLALTEAQRQKLEPIADRLVKDVPQLYPEGDAANYYSISPDAFYSLTSRASTAEVKPILDATQLKRWQELSKPSTPVTRSMAGDDDDADSDTSKDTEPEDVERAVSNFFYEKTESERKRVLEENTLKAEDVARVAGLNAEATERLHAAACGATEQTLMTWKWFTEQQIRSQLQDLTPQNVRARLDGMQDFFFQRRFGNNGQDAIWEQTVETVLTEPQQDAWKKETDARDDYRSSAVAALTLAEFDRQTHLTDDQWNKLQPMVTEVLTDYKQGIAQFFAGFNGTPWFLGGPYTLVPIAGIDEQSLKSILTKEQMDLWTGSQQYGNANNLWQVVKQMHGQQQQRTRRTARALIED